MKPQVGDRVLVPGTVRRVWADDIEVGQLAQVEIMWTQPDGKETYALLPMLADNLQEEAAACNTT